MNIFLVPYTWMRHLNVALVCGGAGLIAWWLVLAETMQLGWWSESATGPAYLTAVATFTATTSVLAESSLRRDAIWRRGLFPLLAGLITLCATVFWWWAWTSLVGPLLLSDAQATDLADPSLVALRYRLVPFVTTGIATAIGPLAVRRGRGVFTHLFSGASSGLVAAGTWYALAYPAFLLGRSDLYLSSALAAFAFGAVFGLFAWGIPDALYAGWVRVVTDTRHGRRIPVDGRDGTPRERFVGHFPRGLDLYLPHDEGVLELHVSVYVDGEQRYRARGLTLAPTRVDRFLEAIDLRYDARRPAPIETRLTSGDRLTLGNGPGATVVEFLMLPREER